MMKGEAVRNRNTESNGTIRRMFEREQMEKAAMGNLTRCSKGTRQAWMTSTTWQAGTR